MTIKTSKTITTADRYRDIISGCKMLWKASYVVFSFLRKTDAHFKRCFVDNTLLSRDFSKLKIFLSPSSLVAFVIK